MKRIAPDFKSMESGKKTLWALQAVIGLSLASFAGVLAWPLWDSDPGSAKTICLTIVYLAIAGAVSAFLAKPLALEPVGQRLLHIASIATFSAMVAIFFAWFAWFASSDSPRLPGYVGALYAVVTIPSVIVAVITDRLKSLEELQSLEMLKSIDKRLSNLEMREDVGPTVKGLVERFDKSNEQDVPTTLESIDERIGRIEEQYATNSTATALRGSPLARLAKQWNRALR